jgi:Bacterial DNA-binding protein
LQAKVVVQKTMDAIVAALLTDRRIELRGFGVFEVKKRAARNARNPRTGKAIRWLLSHAGSEQECEPTRPMMPSLYRPNIFATIKIRTAPPRPPPNSKYTSEYPIAASGSIVCAKSSTMCSLRIPGQFYDD